MSADRITPGLSLIETAGAFSQFFPKTYKSYHDQLGKLYTKFPYLKRNFNNSVFPAASFNVGPSATTVEHTDHLNRACGQCAIFCAGKFDPRTSGHLILRQLGLVIEFPPGSVVLIPSASLVHGNVGLQPGESRCAFTQYAAGGLFRYVDYGYRSWEQLQEKDPELAAYFEGVRGSRWKTELDMFSLVDELHRDRERCGLLTP